jgi:hypothetical protein
MSEKENRGQIVIGQKSSVAEGRFNENGVGGVSLVSGHPHITEDDLTAQIERRNSGKL